MKIKSLLCSTLLVLAAQSAIADTNVSGYNSYNYQVSGSTPTLTDLGSFAAGIYNIGASGTVDLVGSTTFTMKPDGTPLTGVTASGYAYFNPGGSNIADGIYGFAGSGFKIGSLVGSFSAAPTASDWFLIGSAAQVVLAGAGHIYAAVNDTYSINNSGAFSVSVTAVPEPESYAMFLAGLGLMGVIARRRKVV